MIVFPAIDLKGGKCVRLRQGRADDETIYSNDPAQVARQWRECGAEFLHVVDLDGAFTGTGANLGAAAAIAAAFGGPVQLGGGIRTMHDIQTRFDFGVERVILGTAALEDPDFTRLAAERFGERIVAGIDAKDGFVAIKGWMEKSAVTSAELCTRLLGVGISTCVFTDISKDGMLGGPNLEATKAIIALGMNVIASGGISSIDDITACREIGAYGAIVGKALYDGRVDLKAAIAAVR